MLRKYELLYILRHDSAPDITQAAIDKVKDTISTQGGTILLHESWGKKKLAYEIKKASKGIYQLTTFAGESNIIRELERNLRIHPEVMRWLTVQLEGEVESLEVEVEKYSKITPKMVPFDGDESSSSGDDSTRAEGTGGEDKKAAIDDDSRDDDSDDDSGDDDGGEDDNAEVADDADGDDKDAN